MKGRKNQTGARSKYPLEFREKVARDYESGDLSYQQIAEKYGLPGYELPKSWVRSFRKKADLEVIIPIPMTEKEKQEQEQEQNALKNRIAELEKLLADAELRALAYDTMIDMAEEELGVDIRKKPGTKQSND